MQPPPPGPLDSCLQDWETLQQDFQSIQEAHRLYRLKLEELIKLQNNCTSSISRQKKRLQELALVLRKCKPSLPSGAEEAVQELENQIKERQGLFFDMEAYLPKKNGLYLSLVLGNVNVTLLSKQAKWVSQLGATPCAFSRLSGANPLYPVPRVTDAAFNFLLVWYYCTLTIRESILINNGSRIKGWWVFHHYVSTFLSGVMLTWPDGLMYQRFRNQFLSFSMYQSFVQFLQYYYQSGCLYRLRALGERHTMDLTVGAHVRPPLPPPLPRQFLHHPAGRAPEVPQSVAWEQERMRLGLPLQPACLLQQLLALRGCFITGCLRGGRCPSCRRVSFALPWVLWALWALKATLERKTWVCAPALTGS
ncbi:ion channel TACAN isoform X2 [Loxodonta africana]|uniref:ion channel TACAN isoform X2 n=1 Tax=Loxodonta africana TaxID=9785 RepID=UPI000C812DC8|nr:transmembrane protein 120A isoform X2 [Loxodonta africana]